jgi:tetratricopeptide (TPR) repeat protein
MAATARHRDRLGLELTAASGEAARAYDDAVWAFIGFAREPGLALQRALEADAAMPMALCLQGYFLHLMGSPALALKARATLQSLEKIEAMNPRERAHVAALGAWCAGELEEAAQRFDAILAEHPRDFLALKLANYLYFYLGDAAGVRDGPARALKAWDPDMPGYGHLLALHAFGLEESGDYAAAERDGRRAAELNPADPWAVHAVAHVLEMQDRVGEGADWIETLAPHWDAANFFRFHLWWHLALMRWSAGRADEAMRLYDTRVWGDGASENLSLCNDISMLARLELAGVDVGPRWNAAADLVRGQLAQGGGSVLAFVDAHYALALGALPPLAERGSTARIHAAVGRALCDAMIAWRSKDHRSVVTRLAPVHAALPRVGGSHAQRDLFTLLLLDAARQTGERSLARDLLAERARRRSESRLPARLTSG